MNLNGLIDLNARKHGHKDALRYNGAGLSFAELKDQAERAAAVFQQWGVKKGDKLAIMSLNTPAFVTAFFGALKAGATVVPVNHKLTAPEVGYILENSEAGVILFDGALKEVAAGITLPVKKAALDSPIPGLPDFETEMQAAPAFQPVKVDDDDLAEILYTSGTTGKPKGCMHSHRNVIFAAITGAMVTKMDERDRLLTAMPIWHSSPLNNWFMGAQFVGATSVLLREYHPLHFLQAVQDEACTVYFGAPISYILPVKMIPNFGDFDLSSMRCWIYGGGPIAGDMALQLIEKYRSSSFYQVYGMTETGPTGTFLAPADQVPKAGSIGAKALIGADMMVMTSETQPAAPGEVGEIWLKADSMMLGYYRNPDATAAAFHDGWYKTGDLARLDDDGYLFIVDRRKDMIITGGENVYSKEVEDAISAHPEVVEAAVIGKPHPEWGETVMAVIAPAPGAAISAEDIRTFLADRLAAYKIPRIVEFTESLPHTPTGKVTKYKLRENFG